MHEKEPHKIFGIGMERTGTATLIRALSILGISALHRAPYVLGVIETEKKLGVRPLLTLGYQAYADHPIPELYQELDGYYPKAKFIATFRDFDSWFKSKLSYYAWDKKMVEGVAGISPERVKQSRKTCLPMHTNHYNTVKSYFKDRPDDLLTIDFTRGEGWKELCGFLNIEVPKVDFPWCHKTRW